MRRRYRLPGAAAGLLAALVTVHGQGSAPTPRPLIPLAASTLAADPSPYVGQQVTVTGAVERQVSAAAFTVDQDRTRRGTDVLVLTRALHGTIEPNRYVTVIGEAVRFDRAELAGRAAEFLAELPADVAAEYRGRAAVLASAVIDAAMVDLAKRPPPPLTAEEEAYDAVMKRIGPAFAALRQAMAAADGEALRREAAVLTSGFDDAERFWKARARSDAVSWAQEGRRHLRDLERAAAAERWADVKTSASGLQGTCADCHGAYRERLDDGSYRIKSTTDSR